jgi:DNA-binding MarR family transcriptional regulator
MEAAGLAVRTPHDHDGRVVTVHITPAGEDCQQTVMTRRREIVGEIFAGLDIEDQARLVELVERFIALAYSYVGLEQTFGSPAAAAG